MKSTKLLMVIFALSLILTGAYGESVPHKGEIHYINGLLTGSRLVNYTGTTIENNIPIVAEYNYTVDWLNWGHGITVDDPAKCAREVLEPVMRNETPDDINLVTSAGVGPFLWARLVDKVPCAGRDVFVDTTNNGMSWVVFKGMNAYNYFSGDGLVDTDSEFARKMYPDSEFWQEIRNNMSDYRPDVQVLSSWYNVSSSLDFGFFDCGGIGTLFKPFPGPKPLRSPYDHITLLSHRDAIDDMFAALNISKINQTSPHFFSYYSKRPAFCGAFSLKQLF